MKHSGFSGWIGVAREDITPPVGIYCRNWGAAKHDAAEGLHRPLTLTALSLQQDKAGKPLVLIDTDLGWWAQLTYERRFRQRALTELGLDRSQYIFGFTHTHGTPPLCDPEPHWKGGELLPAFCEKVFDATIRAVRRALATAQPATLEWHTGHSNLAGNRDRRDGKRLVCGYNEAASADTTLVVGRVTNAAGQVMATLANYACHPTTLAWENKLVSPDFVGAMRETVQQATGGAPALFLQGASGELGPKHGFVGSVEVADSHGRQLGYAVLATLEDMEPPAQEFVFDRVVESGAPLAVWKRQPTTVSRELKGTVITLDAPLKDWPSAADLQKQYEECPDRTLKERLRRKMRIRQAIGDGQTFPLEVWAWRVGDAVICGSMVEAYSQQQRQLRAAFPDRAIVWMNLINGSLGYMPPAALYDEDIYQVWQTPFERGGLELLTQTTAKAIRAL